MSQFKHNHFYKGEQILFSISLDNETFNKKKESVLKGKNFYLTWPEGP